MPVQRFVAAGSSNPPATASQPRLDPHAIAQQVYRIIKQRLIVERERAGAARSHYG